MTMETNYSLKPQMKSKANNIHPSGSLSHRPITAFFQERSPAMCSGALILYDEIKKKIEHGKKQNNRNGSKCP